jgi:hypothetical protein
MGESLTSKVREKIWSIAITTVVSGVGVLLMLFYVLKPTIANTVSSLMQTEQDYGKLVEKKDELDNDLIQLQTRIQMLNDLVDDKQRQSNLIPILQALRNYDNESTLLAAFGRIGSLQITKSGHLRPGDPIIPPDGNTDNWDVILMPDALGDVNKGGISELKVGFDADALHKSWRYNVADRQTTSPTAGQHSAYYVLVRKNTRSN